MPHLTLPSDLLKLERHFDRKVLMHNEKHRQRCELKNLRACLARLSLPDSHSCSFLRQPGQQPGPQPAAADTSQQLSTDDKTGSAPDGDVDFVQFDGSRLLIQHTTRLHHCVRRFRVNKNLNTCSNRATRVSKKNKKSSKANVAEKIQQDVSTENTSDLESSMGSLSLGNTETSSNKQTEKKTLREAIESLGFEDIEFVHVYSEGAEITVADLILLTYIYHLVVRHSSSI